MGNCRDLEKQIGKKKIGIGFKVISAGKRKMESFDFISFICQTHIQLITEGLDVLFG